MAIMASSPEPARDLTQYIGQYIPTHYDPGIIVLSYVVSLVGAASTLELINRRTSRKGLYNHLLLLGAALSMGGVSIWCMHFIGNRAIGLLDGEPELQIGYSLGVTVASLFVPIFVLLVAFYVVSLTSAISWWRIGVSGTLSGGAICGMHYLGNASISNYKCQYSAGNVAGAAVIAAAASTIALALFFVFRAAWTNSWWKRVGCAVVLASAVSGMHWCAAVGTRYQLVHLTTAGDFETRNKTVIAVSCLSVAACVVMAIFAISSARIRRGYASKAQKITLAAAVFDRQGRILVTPDGLLPSEEITSTFMQKTQDDVFCTAHPLFHWVYQASRNWPSVVGFIDKMGDHLSQLPHHGRNIRTGLHLVDREGRIIDNYDTIFRELFCLAAACLAEKMNEALVDAGTLWEEIFSTGGGRIPRSMDEERERTGSSGTVTKTKEGDENLAEKGLAFKTHQAHGSLMMLVRRLDDNHVVDKLEASGYRFAELRQVAPIIGSTMLIRTHNFEEKLRSMAGRTQVPILDPGVHLGLFVLRSRADMFGHDVLVRDQAQNLLPSVWVPLDRLEPSHIRFLRHLDGQTLATITSWLGQPQNLPQQDARFAGLLGDAIQDLRGSLPDPIFDEAKIVSKPMQVPCNSLTETSKQTTCSLIAFTLVLSPNTTFKNSKYRFIPLQFLKTQQLVYDNSPHRAAFARSVHRDIVPVLNSIPATPSRTPLSSSNRKNFVPLGDSQRRSPFDRLRRSGAPTTTLHYRSDSDHLVSNSREHMGMGSTPSNASMSSMQLYPLNSGETETTDRSNPKMQFEDCEGSPSKVPPQQSSYGGIMISSEVTVDVEVNEVVPSPTPTEPPKTGRSRSHSNLANLGMTRQKSQSQRAVLQGGRSGDLEIDGHNVGGQGGSSQMSPTFEQSIELTDVSTVLGVGLSKVVVKKEGEVSTFVDELAGRCLDTYVQRRT